MAKALQNEKNLSTQVNELNRASASEQKNVLPPKQKQAIASECEQRRKAFVEASKNLQPLVDKTKKQYSELSQDSTVKNALNVLRGSTKAQVALGPTPEFTKMIKQWEESVKACSAVSSTSQSKKNSKLESKAKNTSKKKI